MIGNWRRTCCALSRPGLSGQGGREQARFRYGHTPLRHIRLATVKYFQCRSEQEDHAIRTLLQRALGYNSFNEWKNVFDETTTRPTIGLRMPLCDTLRLSRRTSRIEPTFRLHSTEASLKATRLKCGSSSLHHYYVAQVLLCKAIYDHPTALDSLEASTPSRMFVFISGSVEKAAEGFVGASWVFA